MSTVIVTPLFPPDPSDSARYTKLLAEKLQPTAILAFGALPEAVRSVSIIPISKRTGRWSRAVAACKTLISLRPTTIIVQNGPSSELATLIYTLLYRPRLIYVTSDHDDAMRRTGMRKWLARSVQSRAVSLITTPTNAETYLPPEWLPTREPTKADLKTRTDWWKQHLQLFKTV